MSDRSCARSLAPEASGERSIESELDGVRARVLPLFVMVQVVSLDEPLIRSTSRARDSRARDLEFRVSSSGPPSSGSKSTG